MTFLTVEEIELVLMFGSTVECCMEARSSGDKWPRYLSDFIILNSGKAAD